MYIISSRYCQNNIEAKRLVKVDSMFSVFKMHLDLLICIFWSRNKTSKQLSYYKSSLAMK